MNNDILDKFISENEVKIDEIDFYTDNSTENNINNLLENSRNKTELLEKKEMSNEVDKEVQNLSKKISGWLKKTKSLNGRLMLSGLYSLLVGSYYTGDEKIKQKSIAMARQYLSVVAKL